MIWIPLDKKIVKSLFNRAELAAVEKQLADDTDDPVANILADTAADIRARLSAGGRTPLEGTAADIPQALMTYARAIVRFELLTLYSLTISDPRTLQYEKAQTVLRDIAAGTYVLTDTGSTTPPPTYHGRPRRWGPRQNGAVM